MISAKILFSLPLTALACSFEGVAEFAIKSEFKPELLQGFWYEQSYSDFAQIGSTCQTLDVAFNESTQTISSNFSVMYRSTPFTIVENYAPQGPAVYRKSVKAPHGMPGGSLVGLPTAVIGAELSATGSEYQSLSLYSCFKIGPMVLHAIEIFSRSSTLDEAKLEKIIDSALARGIPIPKSKLIRVNHAGCGSESSQSLLLV
eukprot:TRINITY_DN13392_c0_g1_i2.p1 TRINITY_DN13392_c0_g1~~TRINITY_DN13392_c0_g1_i2.p1  ORF type:complete len:224 (-),score=30.32 TRINITY_DN13392_c0_g1_i2:8-613(-)